MKFFSNVLLCITFLASVAGAGPQVNEVLDKYSQTQDKARSFIATTQSSMKRNGTYSGEHAHYTGKRQRHYLSEFRTDVDRVFMSVKKGV